jgi:hypothetical protein
METTHTKARQTLEMDLDRLKRIDDKVGQWMILEEHWIQHNLDRREQLGHARQLFEGIQTEIKAAYRTCPTYSAV